MEVLTTVLRRHFISTNSVNALQKAKRHLDYQVPFGFNLKNEIKRLVL